MYTSTEISIPAKVRVQAPPSDRETGRSFLRRRQTGKQSTLVCVRSVNAYRKHHTDQIHEIRLSPKNYI